MSNPKAAPPFATSDGKPVPPEGGASGNDFQKNPAGGGTKTGGRNFNAEGRPQSAPGTAAAADAPHLRSRQQQAGSPEQRVAAREVPAGGTVTKADPGAATKAIGAQGLDRPKPFKNMK